MVRLLSKKKGNNVIDLEGYRYACHFCKKDKEKLYFCEAESLLICWDCIGYGKGVHSRYSASDKMAHYATEHTDLPVHEVKNG